MGLTISTRSPSRSVVAAYSLFGVTSRFTATAVYLRVTPRWVRSPSTLIPSATSMSLPFTEIFISKNGRAPSRVRPLVVVVFPSLELPSAGSRGPGPHPVLRKPPPGPPAEYNPTANRPTKANRAGAGHWPAKGRQNIALPLPATAGRPAQGRRPPPTGAPPRP